MKNKVEKKIYVKLTEDCNYNCDHCYIKTISEQRAATLSVQKVSDYIVRYMNYWYSKLGSHVSFTISFHGGEPFLNFKYMNMMKEIIETIKSKTDIKFSVDATTNLMTECFADDIYNTADFISKYFRNQDLRTSFLKISYDFGDVRFKKCIDEEIFIERAKKLRERSCEYIKLKVNICLTTKFLEFVKKYGILAVQQKIYDIVGRYGEVHFEYLTKNTTPDPSLIPSPEEIDKVFLYPFYRALNFSFKEFPSKTYKVDNFEDIEYALDGEFIGCRARQCMHDVITINPSGKIIGCPNTSESFATIDDDIYEPKADFDLVVKEKKVNMECMFCNYYKICNGGCFQLAENGCTFPKVTADFIAYRKKNRIENPFKTFYGTPLENFKAMRRMSKDHYDISEKPIDYNESMLRKIYKHEASDDEIMEFLRFNQNPELTPEVTEVEIQDAEVTTYHMYCDILRDVNRQILIGTCALNKIPLKAYYVHLVYAAGATEYYGLSFRRALALMPELLLDQYGINTAECLASPNYLDMVYDYYNGLTDKIVELNDMEYFKKEFGWYDQHKIRHKIMLDYLKER